MTEQREDRKGSLVVVGTGIRILGQLTVESIAWMKRADRVLYLMDDPVAAETIGQLNPEGAESLARYYAEGKLRKTTYEEIVEHVLESVRSGNLTCLAVYGHPGVFADPSHEAIRRARAEGFPARMLPAISAEDCLFADLEIDPATSGCQSYDATDFLVHRRTIDPSTALILWQIGAIGEWTSRRGGSDLAALPRLIDRLVQFYPPDHACWLYQASVAPGSEPLIRVTTIRALDRSAPPIMSTLYVPPSRERIPDPILADRIPTIAGPAESAGTAVACAENRSCPYPEKPR
jgi:uncharacterized protein YabN with tetrapyrrole methylase and pyrophosphatase domain